METKRIERQAWQLAQSIKVAFADIVKTQVAPEWNKLPQQTQRMLLGVHDQAVETGYATAYPWLLDAYQRDVNDASSQVEFPEAFLDVACTTPQIKSKLGAFTIVRNESFFLEVWCQYYGNAFGFENLYVLDNSSDDGSVQRAQERFPGINVVSVPHAALDWAWFTNAVKCFQRIMLRRYEAVVFSDADEFLVPESETLNEYCDRFLGSSQDYVRARGWGVIHRLDRLVVEPPVKTKLLEDRSEAWRAPQYDKTLLSKVPLEWAKGSHHIYVGSKKLVDDPTSDELTLVHLRDVDVDLFIEQAKRRQRLNAKLAAVSAHGSTDRSQVIQYFRTHVAPWNPEAHEYALEKRQVPDHWKTMITR